MVTVKTATTFFVSSGDVRATNSGCTQEMSVGGVYYYQNTFATCPYGEHY